VAVKDKNDKAITLKKRDKKASSDRAGEWEEEQDGKAAWFGSED